MVRTDVVINCIAISVLMEYVSGRTATAKDFFEKTFLETAFDQLDLDDNLPSTNGSDKKVVVVKNALSSKTLLLIFFARLSCSVMCTEPDACIRLLIFTLC